VRIEAAAKASGPLHAFFVRIRAKRGHQVAAVAVARKLTVLCWHLLNKEVDHPWARPALVVNKIRGMELQAEQPAKKGCGRRWHCASHSRHRTRPCPRVAGPIGRAA